VQTTVACEGSYGSLNIQRNATLALCARTRTCRVLCRRLEPRRPNSPRVLAHTPGKDYLSPAQLGLVCPASATNGQLAKPFADLVGNAIELAMPLAIGFVKQLPLRPAGVVEGFDAKAK
jgi:hypothetical protein